MSRRSGDQDNPLGPQHCRMRAFDRDLIRGGHYGQRSCEPHSKAEHMAAPTNAANVKKALANSEPGLLIAQRNVCCERKSGTHLLPVSFSAHDPMQTLARESDFLRSGVDR